MIVDMMQYGAALSGLQYYSAADKFTWKDIRDGIYGQTLVLREPVVWWVRWWPGTSAVPGLQQTRAGLIAGCTMVLKPAAETPLTINALAEVFAEASLPGRAVGGAGRPETGQALTASPLIDKFTFTGSTMVGRAVGMLAAEKLKPCTWNSAVSRPRSSWRMPTSTPPCRCCCSPG